MVLTTDNAFVVATINGRTMAQKIHFIENYSQVSDEYYVDGPTKLVLRRVREAKMYRLKLRGWIDRYAVTFVGVDTVLMDWKGIPAAVKEMKKGHQLQSEHGMYVLDSRSKPVTMYNLIETNARVVNDLVLWSEK